MPVTNLPYDNHLNDRAKELRRDLTPQERKLWYNFLRGYPVKVYKQRIIESFIVDFYCAEARLVIELDGSQHYAEAALIYDRKRDDFLASLGLLVLRYTNLDISRNFRGVCDHILSELSRRTDQIVTVRNR